MLIRYEVVWLKGGGEVLFFLFMVIDIFFFNLYIRMCFFKLIVFLYLLKSYFEDVFGRFNLIIFFFYLINYV